MEMLARIEETALSIWFRESDIAFFTSLTLHSLAMALVVGVNFAIAFRLIKIVPEFALKPFLKFYQLYWLAVVVIFLSGFAIGLIISGWLQNQIHNLNNGEQIQDKFFWVATLSILVWIGTITTGRFLAYTNSVLLASRFF